MAQFFKSVSFILMVLTNEQILEMIDRGNMGLYTENGGVEGFARELNVQLEVGIADSEAADNYAERIEKYGRNVLPDPPQESWWSMFCDTFEDLMLKILLFAAFLSIILEAIFAEGFHFEDYIETISIFIAVLLVASVQATTNYSQQQSFLEINKLKNSYACTVFRGGHEIQILSTEVLKGDILCLKSGDAIAADSLYISGQDLKVNNSAQTGESDAIAVHPQMPFIIGGTAVESGFGRALVVAIGEFTRSGSMMKKIQDLEQQENQSPLEAKLDNVAILLTYIGLLGAVLTFLVLLVFWAIDATDKNWEKDKGKLLNDLVDKFMTAVTIFICAVPEGLPLAVTLSLGFSMKKMMDDQNFVRHLSACETMGGATAICSDKTGTLTMNQMTVTKFYMVNRVQDSNPELNDAIKDLISESIALNSTAFLTTTTEKKKVGEEIKDITTQKFVGSSSECALLKMMESWGKDYEAIRKQSNVVHVHEFNSKRKKMSTIVQIKDSFRAYAKGGPDFCLPICTHYLTPDGNREELTNEVRDQILNQITEFARGSLRTMLLGYRELEGSQFEESWKDPANIEKDITIIAIVGIKDPLRPEVIKAVEKCRTAGVVVRMVTGDFIETAKAIATECGILDESKGEIAIEGQNFFKLDKLQLLETVPNLRVMARSSPMDKLRLVSFLMECGEVVAVTGDGSNDSPALKQADVGLSMGLCGTELAKMASDIVILDDNFNSIVTALKWGRCVYDNVRGFLQFQLTVNFTAMLVAFIGSIILHDSPLKTIQLLWVNLIMDSFGALALATRGPLDSLLSRPPYGRGDSLLSNVLIRNITGHCIYQIIVLLLILFGFESIFGFDKSLDTDTGKRQVSSLVFNTFVYMQVFNLINARIAGQDQSVMEGLFTNNYFIGIFLGIAIFQVLITETFGKAFHVIGLPLSQWLLSLGFALGVLIVGAFLRMIPLEDHTSDKLNALRKLRTSQVRRLYEGMPFDDQFKRRIDNDGDVIIEGQEQKVPLSLILKPKAPPVVVQVEEPTQAKVEEKVDGEKKDVPETPKVETKAEEEEEVQEISPEDLAKIEKPVTVESKDFVVSVEEEKVTIKQTEPEAPKPVEAPAEPPAPIPEPVEAPSPEPVEAPAEPPAPIPEPVEAPAEPPAPVPEPVEAPKANEASSTSDVSSDSESKDE